MANESNDKNFKKELTDELKRKIQESVKKSFEKNVKGRGETENLRIGNLEKSAVDNVNEYKNTEGTGSERAKNFARKRALNERDKYLQKQGALGDFNELRRIDSMSRASQEEQIRRIKEEVKEEATKETERMSKQVKSIRGKAMLKLAGEHLDKLAFVISQKMAEQAKSGGIGGMMTIGLTYVFALGKDLLDFTGVGAIAGILTGILVGAVIALFWVQVAGGWKGGMAQRILIKKILKKIGIAAFIETLPGPNFIPTFIIMNLWSHYDYIKAKRKAKSDLQNFKGEYKTNKAVIESHRGEYMGS